MRGWICALVAVAIVLCAFSAAAEAAATSRDAGKGTEACRVALLKAAKAARADGKLGFFQYRKVVNLTDPEKWFSVDRKLQRQTGQKLTYGDEVAVVILEAAVAEGKLTQAQADAGAIDWDAIIAFLKELMPMIQELIQFIMDLFAVNTPIPLPLDPLYNIPAYTLAA